MTAMDTVRLFVHSHGAKCAQDKGQLVPPHDALGRVDLADLPASCRTHIRNQQWMSWDSHDTGCMR